MFFAILALFILPDFPSNTSWLTPEERRLAEVRMASDFAGIGDEQETESGSVFYGLKLAMTDWKVWWLAVALCSNVVSLSFNAFFPTLSATLGFNTTITLVLCAPPFIWSAIETYLLSWYV